MMGSWRYYPVDRGRGRPQTRWKTRIPTRSTTKLSGTLAKICPMCGHKTVANSTFSCEELPTKVADDPDDDLSGVEPTKVSSQSRLMKTNDVESLCHVDEDDLVMRSDNDDDAEIYDVTYSSSHVSSQNNIYEAIEGSQNSVGTIGTESNSLYLCISEGRRNHLKSHMNVGWDDDSSAKEDKVEANHEDDTTEDGDASKKIVQRKKVQLRRSLTRTCSSIIESIKSLF